MTTGPIKTKAKFDWGGFIWLGKLRQNREVDGGSARKP